jgi:hypothetical protein
MRLYEFVSRSELNNVKKIADRIWKQLGIDIAFTNHFFDRVNDRRNYPVINAKELADLFIKQYHANGKLLKNEDEVTVVLQDLFSNINIPVQITNKKDDQKRLVAKTVMRTDNFKTPEKTYPA